MFIVFFLVGCFSTTNPCDDYCNYICDCHADDPNLGCDECFTTYDGADASLQDECETNLIDQKNQDQQDTGFSCEAGSGTSTTTTTGQ